MIVCVLLLVMSTVLIGNSSAASIPEDFETFGLADCSEDTDDIDSSASDEGFFHGFKWSKFDQDCIERVLGASRPTKNNFKTKEECIEITLPICKH
ncbi:hypothetical protein JTB14_030909 [Gonioctena quinquepunctata]|nr:hypothetical protein JTB14_030909 [Gonioctena quinquepunctata]